jgi:hypothetical protein
MINSGKAVHDLVLQIKYRMTVKPRNTKAANVKNSKWVSGNRGDWAINAQDPSTTKKTIPTDRMIL